MPKAEVDLLMLHQELAALLGVAEATILHPLALKNKLFRHTLKAVKLS
jgi:hypothetical protein